MATVGNICKHRAGVRSWKTPTALSEQYVTQQTHKREHAESPRADPLLLSVQLGECLHYDANVCIWTRTHIITVTPKNVAATKSTRLPRRKITHGDYHAATRYPGIFVPQDSPNHFLHQFQGLIEVCLLPKTTNTGARLDESNFETCTSPDFAFWERCV